MEEKRNCTSCGRHAGQGSSVFLCPACSRIYIVRCSQCRDQSTFYHCKECGYKGP